MNLFRWLLSLFSRPTPTMPVTTPISTIPAGSTSLAEEFTRQLNAARAAVHVGPVTWDEDLARISVINDQAEVNFGLRHYVTEGHAQVAGEGYPDISAALWGWLLSPAHRAIILDGGYTRVGAAHDGRFWTATFM